MLQPGTKLGPYEVLSLLGAGGMGEVYKARDTRLERFVALKVLAPHLTHHAEARERFEREAKAVASLNHPHICVLYDIGQQEVEEAEEVEVAPRLAGAAKPAGGRRYGRVDYLVLEYLEGESLAQRLRKGPLPLDLVLRYATEVADALDKAHRAGVTHRDVKPGNIIVTKEGTKLLDFGLAKLKQEVVNATVPASERPTVPGALTQGGTILGTLHYMSPEQLESKEVDGRADIFSFGACVHEMLTGKKAFPGDTQASIIAKILDHTPPPISSLEPPGKLSPPALDRLVATCLAKDREDRWQAMRDVCKELRWVKEGGAQAAASASAIPQRKVRDSLGWVAAMIFLVVAVAALALPYFRQPETATRPVRFSISPPEHAVLSWHPSVEISPDGSQVAFVATVEDKQFLWVRSLDSLQARPLPGTEGALFPFWSPDGQYIAFFSGTKLYKIAISGGSPQAVCDVPGDYPGRGTWNQDGIILFVVAGDGPLYQVSAAGGEATPVTDLDESKQELWHSSPDFLPDGRHFLYLARSSVPENNAVYLGSLDSREIRRLFSGATSAKYGPPGYLLFRNQSTLMAQPFDAARLELSGEPFPIVDTVYYDTEDGNVDFSVSTNGVLAYRGGSQSTRLVWLDRTGKEIRPVGPAGEYRNPKVSPDETRIMINRADPQTGNSDLWLYDLARDTASRFTFHPATESDALWSPDGQNVVFFSNRDGTTGIYQKLASGVGQEENLVKSEIARWPQDWSSDGRFIVYEAQDATTKLDLWVLPLFGDRKPFPFLQTEFSEREGRLSSNGRWMAYDSTESGRREVYVQSFPTPGSKWQISTGGGVNPRWRRDGRELFYLTEDGRLMAVPVSGDATFEAGSPKPLFQTRIPAALYGGMDKYGVSADGQRFLMNVAAEEAASPITVVLNWTAGIRK